MVMGRISIIEQLVGGLGKNMKNLLKVGIKINSFLFKFYPEFLKIYISILKFLFLKILILLIAMSIFGRDWKRVESHIGTRSGAQIRSHA